jgi:hypothetical protein
VRCRGGGMFRCLGRNFNCRKYDHYEHVCL